MRVAAVSIVLLMACSAGSEPEHAGVKAQVSECSVAASARFFRDVTQVDYSYQPLSAAALIEKSSLVVRAHAYTVVEGQPEPPLDNPGATTRATFSIDDVYKGAANRGSLVHVHLPRSPVITPEDLRSLNTELPSDPVTLFLTADTLHPAGDTLRLTTPQGLIVSAACGTEQALDAAPTFSPPVTSDAELEGALRKATANDPNAACSTTTAARLFWEATRFTYDYSALPPKELVKSSDQVVRGRLKTLTAGQPESTVLTVIVDQVYKGPAKVGDTVQASLSRAPIVTEKELSDLTSRLRDTSVTMFIYEDYIDDQPGLRNWIYSPQGLLVAADCGVSSTLVTESLFGEAVNSAATLDTAVREAVSSATH